MSAVNSSSQHVRNFYITFLLAGIYIAIIIWSTTDMMLLKETPVNLPLLNAELPITGFYRFAPFFYLLVHFNLLLQLCLLSDKLHSYNAVLSKLEDKEAREYYDIRLFPFVFSHTLSGTQHSGFLKLLLTAMVWVTLIWLPLCLLIGLQVGFLAYHSEQVLELQRWAIVADLFILTIFWPIIRSPDGKWLRYVLWATGISSLLFCIKRLFFSTTVDSQQGLLPALIQWFKPKPSGLAMVEGLLSVITLMAVFGFSYGVAVLPDSDNEMWAADKVLKVAQWFDNANEIIGLGVVEEKGENPAKFVDAWLSTQPLNKEGQPYFRLTERLFDRKYLPMKDAKGNIQQGKWDIRQPRDSIFHRNLRLREKQLTANEWKQEDVAQLTDSDNKVPEEMLRKIVGLDLKGRDLRYADFSESLMPKVDFQEINGVSTKLDFAKFYEAELFKARMWGAQLQGADLMKAELQGANLRWAMLQGAVLYGADLKLSNLTHAIFGKMSEQKSKALFKVMSENIVDSPRRLAVLQYRLSIATKITITLAKAQGQKVWLEEPDEIVLKAFKKSNGGLNFAKSEEDYQNGLADLLIELSCQDKWAASGIIRYRARNMPLESSFAKCLLSLKDKKNKSGLAVCPGLSEISKKDIESLKKMASKTEPENNIQSAFKCETVMVN